MSTVIPAVEIALVLLYTEARQEQQNNKATVNITYNTAHSSPSYRGQQLVTQSDLLLQIAQSLVNDPLALEPSRVGFGVPLQCVLSHAKVSISRLVVVLRTRHTP